MTLREGTLARIDGVRGRQLRIEWIRDAIEREFARPQAKAEEQAFADLAPAYLD